MINVYPPIDGDDDWTIWTDIEGDPKSGRCLSVGKDKKATVIEAITEIQKELAQLFGIYNALTED